MLFEHDNVQHQVDLGKSGPGPGDQFNLAGGQIVVQGVADTAGLFGSGDVTPISIVGGTGIYQNARGTGTIQVPPDVPNQADANIVLNLTGG